MRAVIAHPVVPNSTMSVTLHTMRKKLPRDIEITNIPKLGYALDTKSRDQIHKLLAEYDVGIALTRLKPKPDASTAAPP